MFRIIRSPNEITDEHLASYHNYLKFMEDQLTSAGTKFLGGDKPGFTDYMIWPWFERILSLSKKFELVKIDSTKFNTLVSFTINAPLNHSIRNTQKYVRIYNKMKRDHKLCVLLIIFKHKLITTLQINFCVLSFNKYRQCIVTSHCRAQSSLEMWGPSTNF